MQHDQLHLWFLGDPHKPCYIGELQLFFSGGSVALRYDPAWIRSGFPLSEDLPLREGEFTPARIMGAPPRAAGAVDDARPDRWGEKVIRHVEKPARLTLMEYLYYAGDERFGALGVSVNADIYVPKITHALPKLEDASTLSEAIARIKNSEPLSRLQAKFMSGSGSPLGGAKPKAVIEIGGEQWIIKFFSGEPVDAPLVEHASMTLAARAGIEVAPTQVIQVSGVNAIAISRFDRLPGRRIHAISAGTAIRAEAALGRDPDMGYPVLAQILRRRGISKDKFNERQAAELFRRMVFNILIDNTDDHEKNHALLMDQPQGNRHLRLAPAYDVLPGNSGQGRQEFRCGQEGFESTLSNAISECAMFGLTGKEALAEVKVVVDVVNAWKEHFRVIGVCDADIQTLSQTIDGPSLLEQRCNWAALDLKSNRTSRKGRGPFQG
jgi:serine/threonine-protein kinase HipA